MLFDQMKLGKITLKNRVVMCPLTRSRATADHIPTALMAEYYAQRADAGLIISEGTSPSKNGSGYPRIPGLYNEEQVLGWKKVTAAVHEKNGRIFAQLMHTGAVSNLLNMEAGARVMSASSHQLVGQMYTDQQGLQPHSPAAEMTSAEIESTIEEYVSAARNAIRAGFDGVEVHGANGYLIEQFLRKTTNLRRDSWGGDIQNRSKFLFEVVRRIGNKIGFDRVGVRLSPFGTAAGMSSYPGMKDEYVYVLEKLAKLHLAYVHLLDHSAMGGGEVPADAKAAFRKAFDGKLILAGNYEAIRAEQDLNTGAAQMIAFGRPFISNPDLVKKMKAGAPLTQPDPSTFYTPGAKGYTDYPSSA
ncbi:MAG: alkene reductase [Cryobacterium sp.]|nr:alkene reductase [Oligoflexia bacterium]